MSLKRSQSLVNMSFANDDPRTCSNVSSEKKDRLLLYLPYRPESDSSCLQYHPEQLQKFPDDLKIRQNQVDLLFPNGEVKLATIFKCNAPTGNLVWVHNVAIIQITWEKWIFNLMRSKNRFFCTVWTRIFVEQHSFSNRKDVSETQKICNTERTEGVVFSKNFLTMGTRPDVMVKSF